ncbi:thiol:disulfide interchange protein DsbA/DsbL [Pseudomarimonas arenosa]|uniref:Thiol:disulfide interchange protein DsbA n=1 Tax=Pseudomarimonas arenosa TaxID=2774145 RepID=A0AAW3ZNC8_9GAMM|nr:thiol:disulfide interchange protein DsbA/DsbL [Pseudomarimonas arenosa]MBD8527640.1 thiol:disulfide interchange protein DsbA/DsbL [Pseudomarimonas arenosa]
MKLRSPVMFGMLLLLLAGTLRAEVTERLSKEFIPPANEDKIEVIEVFGYWCIHCATLRQPLEDWGKAQSTDVHLRYLPAVFSGGMEDELARAFFAAEAMGVLSTLHEPLFNAVAVTRRVRDRAGILATVEQAGIDSALFASTMDSFSVRAKANQSKSLMPRYGIGVTPTLIIQGRTLLEPSTGGLDAMLKRADELVAEARARRASP